MLITMEENIIKYEGQLNLNRFIIQTGTIHAKNT